RRRWQCRVNRPTTTMMDRNNGSGKQVKYVSEDAQAQDEVNGEATPPVEADEAPSNEAPVEDPVAAYRRELRSLPGRWYVIHSYAGYENRVKANLESRMQSLNMEDYIFQVEVPMEEVVEIKNSVRKLVKLGLTDESWGAVRHTPGVTGFVGSSRSPVPLTLDEVMSMLAPTIEAKTPAAESGSAPSSSPAVQVEFSVGESVTVTDGPFE